MNYCIFFPNEKIAIEIPLSEEEHFLHDAIKYCHKYLSHFGYINAHKQFTLFPHIDITTLDRVAKWGYNVIPFSVVE